MQLMLFHSGEMIYQSDVKIYSMSVLIQGTASPSPVSLVDDSASVVLAKGKQTSRFRSLKRSLLGEGSSGT